MQGDAAAAHTALDRAEQALGDSHVAADRFPVATAACLALRAGLLLQQQEAGPQAQASVVVWRHHAEAADTASSQLPAAGAHLNSVSRI